MESKMRPSTKKYFNTFGHILDAGEQLTEEEVRNSCAFTDDEIQDLIADKIILPDSQKYPDAISHQQSDNP